MDTAPYARPESLTFTHNKYLLKRDLLTLFGAKLYVYDSDQNLALFVKQAAFKLREDIRVYSDQSMAKEVMSIKARQIIDFSAAYDVVETTTGAKLGAFRRKGWSSMIRDNWQILDAYDVQIGEITEDNMTLALVRRFLSNLVPQGYDAKFGAEKTADYQQRFNPFAYNLDIDFSMDVNKRMDRRVGLCGAILLAAVEGRQAG
ncbi:MAG: hypothetical protein ABL949_01810 [Fimbriimonadaceae bacterium]